MLGRIGLFFLIVAFFPLVAVGALIFGAIVNPIYRQRLQKKFLAKHGSRGHFVLFAYDPQADSSTLIESEILPRIEPHLTRLHARADLTVPRRDRSLELQVLHQYGGGAEALPIAVIVHPKVGIRVIRFGPAIDSLAEDNREHLERRLEELDHTVAEIKKHGRIGQA